MNTETVALALLSQMRPLHTVLRHWLSTIQEGGVETLDDFAASDAYMAWIGAEQANPSLTADETRQAFRERGTTIDNLQRAIATGTAEDGRTYSPDAGSASSTAFYRAQDHLALQMANDILMYRQMARTDQPAAERILLESLTTWISQINNAWYEQVR